MNGQKPHQNISEFKVWGTDYIVCKQFWETVLAANLKVLDLRKYTLTFEDIQQFKVIIDKHTVGEILLINFFHPIVR